MTEVLSGDTLGGALSQRKRGRVDSGSKKKILARKDGVSIKKECTENNQRRANLTSVMRDQGKLYHSERYSFWEKRLYWGGGGGLRL